MHGFSALPTWLVVACIDYVLAAPVPQRFDNRWGPFSNQSHGQWPGDAPSPWASWITETQTQTQTQVDTTCSSSTLTTSTTALSTTTETTITSDSTTTITIEPTSTISLTSTITIPRSTTSTSASSSSTLSITPESTSTATSPVSSSTTISSTSSSTSPSSTSPSSTSPSSTSPSSSASASTSPSSSTSTSTSTTAASSSSSTPVSTPQPASPGHLPLSFVNNFNSSNINAYVTGLDDTNRLVLLQADGTWFAPSAGPADDPQEITADISIPLGPRYSTTNITLPSYVTAARLWFADGTLKFSSVRLQNGTLSLVEPSAVNPQDASANVNWGFVELSYTAEIGVYADISYVDFVGLPVGMQLQAENGTTQAALGLPANANTLLCDDLTAATASDGQPWDRLCVRRNTTANTISTNTADLATSRVDDDDAVAPPLRVLSPIDYLSLDPTAFDGFFTPYVDAVWTHYASATLSIDTQSAAGTVSCRVDAGTDLLRCDGDNRGYLRPATHDIFSCASGPFGVTPFDNEVHRAVVPRLCAAFNRGTLLLPGGDQQPYANVSAYYTNDGPNNRYSAIVHEHERDGKGYAFAYDDVVPDGGKDAAGVVKDSTPALLTVIVGGPLSSTDRVEVTERLEEAAS